MGQKKIKGVQFNSAIIEIDLKNTDFNYEQKMKMYANAYDKDGKRKIVRYQNVVDLVNGKDLITVNFHMEKSRTKGITKQYTIKRIKA